MKKLLEFYKAYKKESEKKEQALKINNAVNGLMKITFSEKSTAEAIEIKKQFNLKFDAEVSKRGLEANIELSDVEQYFNK